MPELSRHAPASLGAVAEMDHVTQQNAAMVEETTSSTHSLSHETEALGQAIARFRVESREPGVSKHGLRAAEGD